MSYFNIFKESIKAGAMADRITPELIEVALEKVEGFAFERFSQDFFSAIEGRNFVPIGGVGDGGADGIFQTEKQRTFYQITRQQNHRDKIRKTVARLREVGRDVSRLVYVTARAIPNLDFEEDELGEELDINLRIRDRRYIISHINDSAATISAYSNHLDVYTQFLLNLKRTNSGFQTSKHVSDPSAFVFLQQELSNKKGNTKLLHSITDTMILWALSETDPDNDILMTESDIKEKIYEHFPWIKSILNMHIPSRLTYLKGESRHDRTIRWYRKQKSYCLPHNTREVIATEASTDESLRIHVVDELKLMASNLFSADAGEYELLANASLEVVHKIFEKQGLLFSHFISSEVSAEPPLVVADCIDQVLSEKRLTPSKLEDYREYLECMLRDVFYKTTPRMREHLTHLSRTYVLLFSLQAEPRVVEFFSNLSAEFKLFLGGDILVKAISERYLDPENQAARNLLKIAGEGGVQLYLSECVLEEVYTHIHATYWEFYNNFQKMEQYMKPEIARNSEKILIRSYFYAREENRVRSWKEFIEQFVSYDKLEKNIGIEDIRRYLVAEFKLRFIPNEELESVCDKQKVKSLADLLMSHDIKENESLAYNTALQVNGVYGMRNKDNEVSSVSELGFRTWWMTNQTRVLEHTKDIVGHNRSEYIMRPEFLLNFIALAPNCESVRTSFNNIFPTAFGVQLGNRLEPKLFKKVLKKVNEWHGFEDGRITALMSDMCDELKTDRLKRYQQNL